MQRPTEIIISAEELDRLKLQVRQEWLEKKVPVAQQSSFETCVYRLSRRKVAAFIAKEMLHLQDKTATVLQAMQAVQLREASLSTLKELAAHIELISDEELQTVASDCAELLETHRMLSLSAVDTIVKWREGLVYALLLNNTAESYQLAKQVAFMWEGENYLVKMKTDNDFMKQSSLNRMFNFSSKNDPFLVVPSNFKDYAAELNFSRQHDGKIVLNLPSVVLNKVWLAELVLMAEAAPENEGRLNKIDLRPRKKPTLRKPSRKTTVEPVVEAHVPQKIFITRPDSEALIRQSQERVDMNLPDLLLQGLIEGLDTQLAEIAEEARQDIFKASSALYSAAVADSLIFQTIDREVIEVIQEELASLSKASSKAHLTQVEQEVQAVAAALLSRDLQTYSQASLYSDIASKDALGHQPPDSDEPIEDLPIMITNPDEDRKTAEALLQIQQHNEGRSTSAKDHLPERPISVKGQKSGSQVSATPSTEQPMSVKGPKSGSQVSAISSTERPISVKGPKSGSQVSATHSTELHNPHVPHTEFDSERQSANSSKNSLRPTKESGSKSPKKQKNEAKQEQLNRLYSRKKPQSREAAIIKDITNDLAFQVLSGYLREFSDEAWVEQLAETVLNDEREVQKKLLRITTINPDVEISSPIDYSRELFTPGLHSPNAFSVNGSNLGEFSDVSSVSSDDASEDAEMYPMRLARHATMTSFITPVFTQMKVKKSGLRFMLMDYYSRLPDDLLETVCPFEELWRQYLERKKTCSWFWMVVDEAIMGLVVLAPDGMNLEALHFSTLSVAPYGNALKLFLEWVWTASECTNIRINLYSKLDEFNMHVLNRSIKAPYDAQDFKWRSVKSAFLPDMNITVMGHNRPPGIKPEEQHFKTMPIKFHADLGQ